MASFQIHEKDEQSVREEKRSLARLLGWKERLFGSSRKQAASESLNFLCPNLRVSQSFEEF
jgi:hypothetical protein